MVRVIVRVEADGSRDPYLRYHGKAVDQPLNHNFWNTQKHKIIEVTGESLIHEETLELAAGKHTVKYSNSGSVRLDLYWPTNIYVNGNLVASQNVGRDAPLTVEITVVAPTPPPIYEWILPAAIVGIPLFFFLPLLFAVRREKR